MPHVNQSGFQPGDSCEYQLLSIVHNIYAGFDQNSPLEVHSCFRDISKAFDKVWLEGLIYKMETMGFTGSILRLFQKFLSNNQWSKLRLVTHISSLSFSSLSIFDLYQRSS